MKGTVISASLVPIGVSVGTFTAMAPDLSDIRRSHNDAGVCKDVRTAELTASVFVLVCGCAAGYLVDSPIPAVVAALVCVILVAMYEMVLAMNPHPERKM